MKGTITLIFVLLATASPTGQWVTKSRQTVGNLDTWYLTHLTVHNVSDSLLLSLIAICASLLALSSLVVLNTMRSLGSKIRNVAKTGARAEPLLSYVTPLYVRRLTQTRNQLANQRRVTQVKIDASFPWSIKTANSTQSGCDLLKKRREQVREKKKQRVPRRKRISPEELTRINQAWLKFYGLKNGDLFHIENEMDNTVAKVPVYSKNDKAIKFDDCVDVVYIENANKGRRVNKCKAQRFDVKCTEVSSVQQIIV